MSPWACDLAFRCNQRRVLQATLQARRHRGCLLIADHPSLLVRHCPWARGQDWRDLEVRRSFRVRCLSHRACKRDPRCGLASREIVEPVELDVRRGDQSSVRCQCACYSGRPLGRLARSIVAHPSCAVGFACKADRWFCARGRDVARGLCRLQARSAIPGVRMCTYIWKYVRKYLCMYE